MTDEAHFWALPSLCMHCQVLSMATLEVACTAVWEVCILFATQFNITNSLSAGQLICIFYVVTVTVLVTAAFVVHLLQPARWCILYSLPIFAIINGRCMRSWKGMSLDDAWMLLLSTTWVWVLPATDSTQEVHRQRMHGLWFVDPSVEERDCCWRCSKTSVLVCWRPVWAGWRLVTGQWMRRHSLYSIHCAMGNQCN